MKGVVLLALIGVLGCTHKSKIPPNQNEPRHLPTKEYVERFSEKMPLLKRFDQWVINDLDGYREYINTIDFYHYSDDTVFRARYKGGIRFDPLYDKYTSGEDIFYAKSYIADGYSYYLSYDENWTLKFKVRYKILSDKRGDLDQEEAIVGWYCKQYENQQLSTIGQWRYFVAREDSLRRVPGDSLPPLPEISLQEFETTMKNQGKYPGRISSSMKKLEKYYLPTPYKD